MMNPLGQPVPTTPKAPNQPETRQWLLTLKRFARNRLAVLSLAVLLVIIIGIALASSLSRFAIDDMDLLSALQGPSAAHWLGVDESGRDVFTRLLYGGRISLGVGMLSMVVGVGVGVIVGGVSAFFGGIVDALLMRITDAVLAIPTFFLALTTMAAFGPSIPNLVLVIGLTSWMQVARIVRAEAMRVMHLDYVQAARSLGARDGHILIRHVLPQTVPSVIVACSLGVPNAIVVESALSYLGLGVQPPAPSWGNMLSNAQSYIWTKPLLALYPGLLILLTVLAFNLVGDALRDALDPRLKGR
jgi:peptide/nickel transport system permease protein